MTLRILADAVALLHFAFVLFVVLGGLLVLRWPKLAWAHLPVVAWGASVEFTGWICPLTPLEKWLRTAGGGEAYTAGFVEHYIMPVLYPAEITREVQYALGALVLLVNGIVYAIVLRHRARRRARG